MTERARLLFGPAGVPHSAPSRSTVAGVEEVSRLGLDCMEVEFVQGVRMSEAGALEVGRVSAEHRVKLSAHGPYFINLNAGEEEKVIASQERIYQTAHIAHLFGGTGVVFHAAFYLKDPPERVYETVKRNLAVVVNRLVKEGKRIWLYPETTGKVTQFGTLEEILRLSQELEWVAPCIDFAHLHARTGRLNSYQEFSWMLDQVGEKLGRKALENLHIHVSGIEYGKQGEKKHLNLKESDFRFEELLQALKEYNARGLVIAESPNLEEDALLLKRTYERL